MQKFTVARDERWYLAWPDLALTAQGDLVCVYAECTHHGDRQYTRIVHTRSSDRGRTWSPARPLTEPLENPGRERHEYRWWNCARISSLADGRLMAVADRIHGRDEGSSGGEQDNFIWISTDHGHSWDGPHPTPVYGIVPDQPVELRQGPHAGRWLLSAHTVVREDDGSRSWRQRAWHSDDHGATWHGPHLVASRADLKLCEGSIVELPTGELVCFLRENSGRGLDAFKTISRDGGLTWDGLVEFPLPACHRPVAGMLADGSLLITHRYMQGGQGWVGWWTQNTFAAVTDVASALAPARHQAHTRILPLDFDRSSHSDTGYTGWVQFPDGEIVVVNYIVDDWPRAQIRAYSLRPEDFLLPH
jgi:sialidase-1